MVLNKKLIIIILVLGKWPNFLFNEYGGVIIKYMWKTSWTKMAYGFGILDG